MTRIDAKALREMEALVEERQKYEKWIGSLGERRSITPSHVFQRVLSDYQERMRIVAADLAGRTADIEGSITHLRERLASVQAEETSNADERAEAELRAAVGEYTPDKWEEIRRVADENIARLSALRMELSGELEHLSRILSVAIQRPPAQSGSEPSSGSGISNINREPLSRIERIEPTPVAASRPAAQVAAAQKQPREVATSFDELAFLSSVVENEISQLPAQPADVPRVRVESDASMERALRATQTPPSSATSKGGRAATPLISESIHSGPDVSESTMRAADEALARGQFDRRLSGSVPAYLKDVSKEATKSLKCQECGTMNYPTEWYCERCGGELAAL